MSKNPKDIQRKEETGTEELEQQVESALERVLSRQLAPVMLKLTDKPAVSGEVSIQLFPSPVRDDGVLTITYIGGQRK